MVYSKYSPISFKVKMQACKEEKRFDLALFSPKHQEVITKLKSIGAQQIRDIKVECIKGKTPTANSYTAEGIPVVKISTINSQGELNWNKVSYISEALYKEGYYDVSLKKDDIVVVATGKGSIGNIAIYPIEKEAITTGENCILRINNSKMDPYYLTAFLLTKYGKIQLDAHPLGPSGQTHLYPRQIDKIYVPLVNQKSKIANRYKKSVKLKLEAKKLFNDIEELFQKYFEKYYNPKWGISSKISITSSKYEQRLDPRFWSPKITTVLETFKNSDQAFLPIKDIVLEPIYRGKQPDYNDEEGSVPVLKTKDVQNRKVDWTECRKVTEDFFDNNPKGQLYKGDIVITSTGEGSWGRATIVDVEKAFCDGHLTIIKVNKEIIDPYSVIAFIWSEFGKIQFEQRVRGSTGQSEIYPQDIEKTKILIPSPEEQALIREKIEMNFFNINYSEILRKRVIRQFESSIGG